MRKLIKLLITPFTALKNAFGKRKPHRRIVIIADSKIEQEKVLSAMYNAECCGAKALHADDESIIIDSQASEIVSTPEQTSAVYISDNNRRKIRRWAIHRPESISANDKDFSWKEECDTIIVAWPSDKLKNNESTLQDLRFRMTGVVGTSKASGKLKRVAIVVTDVDEYEGLSDASQQVFQIQDGLPFTAEVKKQINKAAGKSGHPLADPGWVGFLKKYLTKSCEFVRMIESFRRTLNKNCPIFFIPRCNDSNSNLNPLLKWINDGRIRRPVSYRPLAGFFMMLAILSFFFSLFIFAFTPNIDPIDFKSEGIAYASLTSAIENYRSIYNDQVIKKIINPKLRITAIKKLDTLSQLTKYTQNLDTLETVRKSLFKNIAACGSLNECQVFICELDSFCNSMFADTLIVSNENISPNDQILVSHIYANTISRAALLRGMLKTYSVKIDSSNYSDTAVQLIQLPDTNLYSDLSKIHNWQYSSTLATFYNRTEILSNDTLLGRLIKPVKIALLFPHPDLSKIFDDILNYSQAEIIENPPDKLLDSLIRIYGCENNDSGLLDSTSYVTLKDLRQMVRKQIINRDITITFTNNNSLTWHLDVSKTSKSGYNPTIYLNDPKIQSIKIDRIKPGSTIFLKYNSTTCHHVSHREGLSCTESKSIPLCLIKPEGEVNLLDGSGSIQYKIENWPIWKGKGN